MVIRVIHGHRTAYVRLYLLYSLHHILSCSQKFLTSQLLVIFLIDYADVIFIPALNKHLLNHVQRIQNSYLRFSYCVHKYDHISVLPESWLKIWQRFILHIYTVLYFLSFTPLYLRRLLQLNSEHHSSFNLLVIRYQNYLSLSIGLLSTAFSYTSVKYFNSLPDSIKIPLCPPSLSSFHSAASRFIASLTVFKRDWQYLNEM